MRILLLSQWYDPEPADKIGGLARGLVALGHTVTVLTGFPNYPTGRLYPGYQLRWRQWEQHAGVRVLRLPLYPSHDRSALRRAANYASFALSASLLGPALAGPAEVMWVYHPPLTVGLPAWWLGGLRRIPFIFNIHDMWPETLAATGMMAPAHLHWIGLLARLVYRQAAAITVVSPGFKRNLIAKGVPADKIHVIPNWADDEIYRAVPEEPALAHQYGLAGRFNIVYGGNLGAAQALENVLAAAARLQDLPALQFVLIGEGIEAANLKRIAQARGLQNVRFIPQQLAQDMPRFYALAEVLLVHLKRDPLFEITIPSKTLAYMASGRPILGVISGDAADLVRTAQAGLICPPEDPIALEQAVRTLYAMPRAQREAMGEAGRQAFERDYAGQALIKRHWDLMEQVALTKPSKPLRSVRRG